MYSVRVMNNKFAALVLPIFLLPFLFCACRSVDSSAADVAMEPAEMLEAHGELAMGTKPFQGIPSIATSKTGKRIFLAWYGNGKTECPDNYIMVAYGVGNEWKNKVDMVVRSPHVGKVRLFDPSLWRAPDGSIWLFWAQSGGEYVNKGWLWHKEPNLRGQWDRRGGVWYSVCKNPEAEKPAWSAPRRLCDGVMMNKPIVLKNGKWAFPVCKFQMENINDLDSSNEGAILYVSDSDAKNPKLVNCVKIPFVPFTEHMFVEKLDGSIWLLSRTQPDWTVSRQGAKRSSQISYGNDGILEAFSQDGGKTFGEIKASKIPHCGSRFHISRLNSGNLLLVKNDADDAQWLAGKPRGPENLRSYPRKKIMAYLSRDDGKTWEGGLEIDGRADVSYPDADQDVNGDIYVCYDHSRYGKRQICVAKIRESDILAGKSGSSKQYFQIANERP